MSKINWKVRFKSKTFWLGIASASVVFAQEILHAFGINWDNSQVMEVANASINIVFLALACLGVVVDPTTGGVADSARALGYEEPATNIDGK